MDGAAIETVTAAGSRPETFACGAGRAVRRASVRRCRHRPLNFLAAAAAGCLLAALPETAPAQAQPDPFGGPAAAMEHALTEAENLLHRDEPQAAESWYREALLEAWLLLGDLHRAGGAPAEAESAYERALVSALEARRPLLALAELALEGGDPDGAANHLRRLLVRHSGDGRAVRLLAQAFSAGGKPELAVQQLERAVVESPGDLETRFALASGYLRLDRPDAAAELFEKLAEDRPIPQTWVLIGRTYRDFGRYDHGRAALERALQQDPKLQRAHYHLGLLELLDDGLASVEAAIENFEKERRVSPEAPVNALYLGMALVAARRFEEALAPLEMAARPEVVRLDALLFQGQALLGLDRPREAADTLERAVGLAADSPADLLNASQMGSVHYQLALALRRSGRGAEAKPYFEAAEMYSASSTEGLRDRLASYLAGREVQGRDAVLAAASVGETAVSGLGREGRERLFGAVRAALARASFNLGVMATQSRRFTRAADHFEQAAAVDPAFPRVQYSLGVARFNAGQFEQAALPLSAALEQQPDDPALGRLLALAWLNAEVYDRAAELLAADPARAADRSLQYAYGLALVRSGRTAEAQPVFDRLLAEHAAWPELNVLLGQAAAQEGDFEAAVEHLERAIELRPDVAEAQSTLGNIYLRQGRLEEAGAALRAELASHPADHRSRHVLATVLELDNQPVAALRELDLVLDAEPDFADARYLRGRILLEGGRVGEAAAQLLAAAELAPEDPNIRNQLGLAYRKLGNREKAREQFEIFRLLKGRSEQ